MENLEMNAQVEETAVVQITATESAKQSSTKKFFVKVGKSTKEFFRKLMVSLKRRPHNIALLMLAVSFIVYSFDLTKISNTTAYLDGNGMGLCEFAIMLFSTLAFVCFLNAFPKRGKPKIFFLVVLFVMLAIIITCDIIYFVRINQALTRADNPVILPEDGSRDYVLKAKSLSLAHIILLGVSTILTATIPLYGRLFKLVNTSIEVEYTEADEEVELAEEA